MRARASSGSRRGTDCQRWCARCTRAWRSNTAVISTIFSAAANGLALPASLAERPESTWLDIFASTINLPLELSVANELGALGAAIVAAVGVGIYPDLHAAVAAMTRFARRIEPDRELSRFLAKRRRVFEALLDRLSSTWGLSDRIRSGAFTPAAHGRKTDVCRGRASVQALTIRQSDLNSPRRMHRTYFASQYWSRAPPREIKLPLRADLCRSRTMMEAGVLVQTCRPPQDFADYVNSALNAQRASITFDEFDDRESAPTRSHSSSFDQRRRPETLRTAIAMAFFWPTRTTRRLPRVTPV